MMSISLHQAGVSFGTHQVLTEVNLELKPGDFLGVTGPSGSGKTTLLKLMAGLQRPTTGNVNHNTNLTLSMAFQEPRLLPWRKAWENVALPLVAKGSSPSKARIKAIQWMKELELQEAIDLYPRQLSGGMAQRLGLARALAVDPQVLLLDEPLSALPEDQRKRLVKLLADYLNHDSNRTLVYVTHYPEEIANQATGWLHLPGDGQIKQSTKHQSTNEAKGLS